MTDLHKANVYFWPGEGYVVEASVDGVSGCYTRQGLQWVILQKRQNEHDARDEERILQILNSATND